jgi:hypothetical protein
MLTGFVELFMPALKTATLLSGHPLNTTGCTIADIDEIVKSDRIKFFLV